MEKFNLSNIGQKAKEVASSVRKGVVLTTAAVGLAAATSQDASAQKNHNQKSKMEQSAETHFKAGPYVFDVKKVSITDHWGHSRLGDELQYKGQKLELNFGISGNHDTQILSVNFENDGQVFVRYTLEGKTFFAEAVFEYQDGSFKKISDKEAPVLELMHR